MCRPPAIDDPAPSGALSPTRSPVVPAATFGGIAALAVLSVGALFWPGIAMYDTVAQYGQVLSGDVDDWHPPVMVRLWQLLEPIASGTAPMFALQVILYAIGFALIIGALVRERRNLPAAAAALLALSPLLLGWQMVVLKDAQMLGALVAAFAIIAHYRLAGRKLPILPAILAALLIGYATLVRANALFATVPLAALLARRPRSLAAKAMLALCATVVLLGVTPSINQRVFGAKPSGVATSQPLFDLAAIAAETPNSVAPFSPAERSQIVRRHCAKSFFWDPVTDETACGPITERANSLPQTELYVDLARAAAAHPLAYAKHRLGHWNSTERWLVPPGLIDAAPPDEAEPNELGLRTPRGPLVHVWQRLAGWEARTPLGWPIIWTLLSLLLVPIAWRRRNERAAGLALALFVSAISLEASFLVVSIASDLRYHLWSMTAVGLGLILLLDDIRLTARGWIAGGTLLLLVAAAGVTTRSSLPRAPSSYEAMLHAPAG